MKIDVLRTLLTLAENNCDFEVHKLLNVSRSTLWGHIQAAENELKIKIVSRSKFGNAFTEKGLKLIPFLKKIHDNYMDAFKSINHEDNSDIEGNVVISTTSATASTWLIPSFCHLRNLYPKLIVNINASDNINKNIENASDIIIRPTSEQELQYFDRVWSIRYEQGLFASYEYCKNYGTPQKSEDLIHHFILAYGEHEFTGFENINWHLKGKWQDLPKLTPCLTINSTSALIKAANEGLGICATPIQSSSIYKLKLINILPHIKGPETNTTLFIKQDLSSAKRNAVSAFGNFFKDYLKTIGVNVLENF